MSVLKGLYTLTFHIQKQRVLISYDTVAQSEKKSVRNLPGVFHQLCANHYNSEMDVSIFSVICID